MADITDLVNEMMPFLIEREKEANEHNRQITEEFYKQQEKESQNTCPW